MLHTLTRFLTLAFLHHPLHFTLETAIGTTGATKSHFLFRLSTNVAFKTIAPFSLIMEFLCPDIRSYYRTMLPLCQLVDVLCVGTSTVQLRTHDTSQQCHLPASVCGLILSIKFSQCFASVTTRCLHDQAQRSVLDATRDDCVQHEICFLPLFVQREFTQQVWRCSSRHIVSNVSEAWVNSCEVRDELESPLVVVVVVIVVVVFDTC